MSDAEISNVPSWRYMLFELCSDLAGRRLDLGDNLAQELIAVRRRGYVGHRRRRNVDIVCDDPRAHERRALPALLERALPLGGTFRPDALRRETECSLGEIVR